MIKSSILDLKSYHTSIKNSVKSKWSSVLILFPLGLYVVYRFLEPKILAAVVAYLPHDKSVGFYRDLIELCFIELLWITAFFTLAWIFVVYVPLSKVVGKIEHYMVNKPGFYVTLIISLSFIASLIISYDTLELFPNSSDEYVYLYQAETLSKGRLWENAHDHPYFFNFNNIAQKDGIRVGRFPPGWPLVLSTAFAFGFPSFLVNPILGLIALIVFYRFAKRFYGVRVALWSLLALALTSFYIFNSASFFSHTSCLLFAVGFVYCIYLYEVDPTIKYGLLAGFLIGMIGLTRYYTALLIVAPFLIYILYKLKFKSVALFSWIVMGALPCLGFLFWYNYSITGNGFLPVTMWAFRDEALGFVQGHTVIIGIEHVIRRVLMLFYWGSPALLILYFIYLIRKITSKAEALLHPEDYLFVLLMIGYFFYYQIGGNQYGPRFFFEALPFLVVFVVNKVFQTRHKWAMALFCSGLIYAVVKIPFISQRENRIVNERNDIYRLAKENNIRDAVIFISSPTSVIRPMPLGDLTRNDRRYEGEVIYAVDYKSKNRLLIEYYPERTFYKYVRDREEVEGKLIRIKW